MSVLIAAGQNGLATLVGVLAGKDKPLTFCTSAKVDSFQTSSNSTVLPIKTSGGTGYLAARIFQNSSTIRQVMATSNDGANASAAYDLATFFAGNWRTFVAVFNSNTSRTVYTRTSSDAGALLTANSTTSNVTSGYTGLELLSGIWPSSAARYAYLTIYEGALTSAQADEYTLTGAVVGLTPLFKWDLTSDWGAGPIPSTGSNTAAITPPATWTYSSDNPSFATGPNTPPVVNTTKFSEFQYQINATDADGNTLTYSISTQGTFGTASVTSGGLVTYTPGGSFTGYDTFVVQVSDGAGGFAYSTITVGTAPATPVESNASISWTTHALPGDAVWTGVARGAGKFVAVAQNSQIVYSDNGETWIAATSPLTNFNSVCFAEDISLFCAVGASGAVVTSPDGVTWTQRTAAQSNTWSAVARGLGLFVAVAASGTNRVMTSPDGITWTVRNAAEANAWRGLAFSPSQGRFVATAEGGTNRVMYSDNGTTWTAAAPGLSALYQLWTVCWSAAFNAWYSLSFGNAAGIKSSDGVTWTTFTLTDSSIRGLVAIDEYNLVLAGSQASSQEIISCRDGVTFDDDTVLPTSMGIQSMCYAADIDRVVAVGPLGTNRAAVGVISTVVDGTGRSLKSKLKRSLKRSLKSLI